MDFYSSDSVQPGSRFWAAPAFGRLVLVLLHSARYTCRVPALVLPALDAPQVWSFFRAYLRAVDGEGLEPVPVTGAGFTSVLASALIREF